MEPLIGTSEKYKLVVCLDDPQETRRTCMLLSLRGHRSLVLVDKKFDQESSFFSEIADYVVTCTNIYCTESVIAALTPFGNKIGGVMPLNDAIWPQIFGALEQLVGRFPETQALIHARLKPEMRRLVGALIPIKWCLVSRAENLQSAVSRLISKVGLPLVLKPIWGHGSNYVEIVERVEDLGQALDRIFTALEADTALCSFLDGETLWDPRNKVLAEAFVPGTEYSLEAVIAKGVFKPLLIQEKYIVNSQDGFRHETCNLTPSPFLSKKGKDAIYRMGQLIADILGLDNTALHIEMTWDGEAVHLIEVNPRMGGGGVPQTLETWFNTTVADWPVRLYFNEDLPLLAHEQAGFIIGVFFNAPGSGVFRGVAGLERVQNRADFAFDVLYSQIGDNIAALEDARGCRQSSLYIYDAFFIGHDPLKIKELVSDIRSLVSIKLE